MSIATDNETTQPPATNARDLFLRVKDEPIREALIVWLESMEARGKYITLPSAKVHLQELKELSDGDNRHALAIVRYAIKRGWNGFYKIKWDKKETQPTSNYDPAQWNERGKLEQREMAFLITSEEAERLAILRRKGEPIKCPSHVMEKLERRKGRAILGAGETEPREPYVDFLTRYFGHKELAQRIVKGAPVSRSDLAELDAGLAECRSKGDRKLFCKAYSIVAEQFGLNKPEIVARYEQETLAI